MRSYNETAAEGDDIRFYGFDMQQTEYNYQFLLEELKSLGHDTAELEKLRDGEEWSALYNREERVSFLTKLNPVEIAVGVMKAACKFGLQILWR